MKTTTEAALFAALIPVVAIVCGLACAEADCAAAGVAVWRKSADSMWAAYDDAFPVAADEDSE